MYVELVHTTLLSNSLPSTRNLKDYLCFRANVTGTVCLIGPWSCLKCDNSVISLDFFKSSSIQSSNKRIEVFFAIFECEMTVRNGTSIRYVYDDDDNLQKRTDQAF